MTGAEILVKTVKQSGIEVCFANAGTTEIPMLNAFDSIPGMRTVLGLFEGVCTGAADGYGRILDKPAMTLLHHGPGFANGIANLHNARRAGIPLLNIVGDHASWHRRADAPLTMDIEKLAETVSGWVKTSKGANTISRDTAEAISEAMYGQISSLIVPHDFQTSQCASEEIRTPHFQFDPVDNDAIEKAVGLLQRSRKTAMILGGRALRRSGLMAAARIKAATGCMLFAETFPGYMERGLGLPDVARIPYFPEGAIEMLSQYEAVILAGAKEPVTFFGYRGIPGFILTDHQRKLTIGKRKEDIREVLECLADRLYEKGEMNAVKSVLSKPNRPEPSKGSLTPFSACAVLAATQPEGAIIVDEGLTTILPYYSITSGLPMFSIMTVTGGAIGYGIPCATGAAVACPDRPVINFQADGSAMYTVQGLWTQARESLNVTTLICSNRSYNILKMELLRAGITSPGTKACSLIDLDKPPVDWVKLSTGFGVTAVSVDTAEDLTKELNIALTEPGPHLIEMVLQK
jgi:acetolactate synthase I/II/III large subunit